MSADTGRKKGQHGPGGPPLTGDGQRRMSEWAAGRTGRACPPTCVETGWRQCSSRTTGRRGSCRPGRPPRRPLTRRTAGLRVRAAALLRRNAGYTAKGSDSCSIRIAANPMTDMSVGHPTRLPGSWRWSGLDQPARSGQTAILRLDPTDASSCQPRGSRQHVAVLWNPSQLAPAAFRADPARRAGDQRPELAPDAGGLLRGEAADRQARRGQRFDLEVVALGEGVGTPGAGSLQQHTRSEVNGRGCPSVRRTIRRYRTAK